MKQVAQKIWKEVKEMLEELRDFEPKNKESRGWSDSVKSKFRFKNDCF